MAERRPILKPRALAPDARIAIIAPASSAREERLTAGIAAIQNRGFRVALATHANGKHAPYFSASVENRLRDLTESFANPEVDAIFCIRGGYGSNYLLPNLPLHQIQTHPKPFFGYSDLTAVQTWLLDQTGLVAFHGPMVAADFDRPAGIDDPSFHAAITGGLVHAGPDQGLRTLRPGAARGVVYGGCLSILTASLGTPYAPQTEGKLLFLEDVAAKPYQVDRMLRQMILAGKFEGVQGFIFGEMLDCVSPGAESDLIERVILDVLADFHVPIAFGLRSGHVSRGNVTLPFGIEAELQLAAEPTLQYLEPAVLV
ncbi:MAG: LD-carboxypeptidase [Acidobacteria bacterium]|nr:LD-carboxypeptidase [Acidobacteriota bacterium]